MTQIAKSSTDRLSEWIKPRQEIGGISLMDLLFNRLDGAYPGRWRQVFQNESSIANWRDSWADAFADEGIKPDEVKRGISACRKQYDWPPSLTEFLKVCRPPIDYESEFYEAVNQMRLRHNTGTDKWHNPAMYWAAAKLMPDMWLHPYQTMKSRWKAALDEAVAANHGDVPEMAKALPDVGKTRTTLEEGRKRLAEIMNNHIKPTRPTPENDVDIEARRQAMLNAVADKLDVEKAHDR